MKNKEIRLIKILNGINKFNESVAENFHELAYHSFDLAYCFTKDTLHSFQDGRCYNCSFFPEPSIRISGTNFDDFKKHFGEGFSLKLIELVDKWPAKNNFPYLHNFKINSLPEYKELIGLFSEWNRLTGEEKLDEIFDIDSIQNSLLNKKNELRDIERKLK